MFVERKESARRGVSASCIQTLNEHTRLWTRLWQPVVKFEQHAFVDNLSERVFDGSICPVGDASLQPVSLSLRQSDVRSAPSVTRSELANVFARREAVGVPREHAGFAHVPSVRQLATKVMTPQHTTRSTASGSTQLPAAV
jgi:hypothetical protein